MIFAGNKVSRLLHRADITGRIIRIALDAYQGAVVRMVPQYLVFPFQHRTNLMCLIVSVMRVLLAFPYPFPYRMVYLYALRPSTSACTSTCREEWAIMWHVAVTYLLNFTLSWRILLLLCAISSTTTMPLTSAGGDVYSNNGQIGSAPSSRRSATIRLHQCSTASCMIDISSCQSILRVGRKV